MKYEFNYRRWRQESFASKMKAIVLSLLLLVVALPMQAQSQTVTLDLKNVAIEEVINTIEKQTEFRFLYNKSQVNVDKKVTIEAKNRPITAVLTQLFKGTDLNYTINGKQIVLAPKGLKSAKSPKKITGVVNDDTGVPVIGANVSLKGTTTGAITDIDGRFSLDATEGDMLQVSYIGYTTKEAPVTANNIYTIDLREDTQALDEVVVVGYGTQKKINLTGSVATVSSKELRDRPVTSVEQALQGQVPGLVIQQKTGQPGNEDLTMTIRGQGTFSKISPLVIVDGVTASLQNISPNDIESISVLKDASATAIYGARAAGGVILVTTKKGGTGKPKISYDGYYGVQDPTLLATTVSAYEHAKLYRVAEFNDNPKRNKYTFTEEQVEKYRTGELPSYDRLNYLFNTAGQTQHNVSINGGSDFHKYYASVQYLWQDGMMQNTGYQQFNFRLNNIFQVTKKLKVEVLTSYSPSTMHAPSEATYAGGPTRKLTDILGNAYRRPSTEPLRLPDGTWGSVTAWANRIGLASEEGGQRQQKFGRLQGSFKASYEIINGLSVSALYGAKVDQTRRKDYSKRMKFYSPIVPGQVDFDYSFNGLEIYNDNNIQQNLEFLGMYDKTFGKDHNFKALVGYTQEWYRDDNETVGRQNFLTDAIEVPDAGDNNTTTWTAKGRAENWALRSFFGRLNYGFKDRYLFEANFRYDGSSRFAKDNRWSFFPSFSGAWRVSEEEFLKNNATLSNLKLRASWGEIGNQSVGLYQYISTIYTGADATIYPNGIPIGGARYANVPNPLLTWETKASTNVGLDFGFFNNTLTASVDYFYERTSDILMQPAIPDTYGAWGSTKPYQNVGIVDNQGFELDIRYMGKINKVNYSVGFNVSDSKSKIVQMVGDKLISGQYVNEVGRELDEWYGKKAIGLFQTEEEVKQHSFQHNNAAPGDIKIAELGGDPKRITDDDRTYLGSSRPHLPFGLSLAANWNGFDFSVFFQGVASRKVYVNGFGGWMFNDALSTATWSQLDYWTEDNRNATFPKPRVETRAVNNNFSSWWLRDASYIRLKNLQVGYTIPQSVMEKLKIDRIRIYLSGENLFTISNMSKFGFDPEVNNTSNGGFYPLARVINIGCNITF